MLVEIAGVTKGTEAELAFQRFVACMCPVKETAQGLLESQNRKKENKSRYMKN
jgi:hypothetical protein